MIGQVIAVGVHQGRWMYVTKMNYAIVTGHVWQPTKQKWTKAEVWYATSAIDQRSPSCPKPAPPSRGVE
jgi:hypothetical protein